MVNSDPEAIMERVRAWQANGMVHPLTCATDSEHQRLVPVEKNGQVVLRCLDCDYEQTWIPAMVTGVMPTGRAPRRR
jgi:hypothetical protein